MNIQQIQYVLALAETRHFERAAERCFSDQRFKMGIERIEY
jgi:DNA-binding transcriptional LysR family regulator